MSFNELLSMEPSASSRRLPFVFGQYVRSAKSDNNRRDDARMVIPFLMKVMKTEVDTQFLSLCFEYITSLIGVQKTTGNNKKTNNKGENHPAAQNNRKSVLQRYSPVDSPYENVSPSDGPSGNGNMESPEVSSNASVNSASYTTPLSLTGALLLTPQSGESMTFDESARQIIEFGNILIEALLRQVPSAPSWKAAAAFFGRLSTTPKLEIPLRVFSRPAGFEFYGSCLLLDEIKEFFFTDGLIPTKLPDRLSNAVNQDFVYVTNTVEVLPKSVAFSAEGSPMLTEEIDNATYPNNADLAMAMLALICRSSVDVRVVESAVRVLTHTPLTNPKVLAYAALKLGTPKCRALDRFAHSLLPSQWDDHRTLALYGEALKHAKSNDSSFAILAPVRSTNGLYDPLQDPILNNLQSLFEAHFSGVGKEAVYQILRRWLSAAVRRGPFWAANSSIVDSVDDRMYKYFEANGAGLTACFDAARKSRGGSAAITGDADVVVWAVYSLIVPSLAQREALKCVLRNAEERALTTHEITLVGIVGQRRCEEPSLSLSPSFLQQIFNPPRLDNIDPFNLTASVLNFIRCNPESLGDLVITYVGVVFSALEKLGLVTFMPDRYTMVSKVTEDDPSAIQSKSMMITVLDVLADIMKGLHSETARSVIPGAVGDDSMVKYQHIFAIQNALLPLWWAASTIFPSLGDNVLQNFVNSLTNSDDEPREYCLDLDMVAKSLLFALKGQSDTNTLLEEHKDTVDGVLPGFSALVESVHVAHAAATAGSSSTVPLKLKSNKCLNTYYDNVIDQTLRCLSGTLHGDSFVKAALSGDGFNVLVDSVVCSTAGSGTNNGKKMVGKIVALMNCAICQCGIVTCKNSLPRPVTLLPLVKAIKSHTSNDMELRLKLLMLSSYIADCVKVEGEVIPLVNAVFKHSQTKPVKAAAVKLLSAITKDLPPSQPALVKYPPSMMTKPMSESDDHKAISQTVVDLGLVKSVVDFMMQAPALEDLQLYGLTFASNLTNNKAALISSKLDSYMAKIQVTYAKNQRICDLVALLSGILLSDTADYEALDHKFSLLEKAALNRDLSSGRGALLCLAELTKSTNAAKVAVKRDVVDLVSSYFSAIGVGSGQSTRVPLDASSIEDINYSLMSAMELLLNISVVGKTQSVTLMKQGALAFVTTVLTDSINQCNQLKTRAESDPDVEPLVGLYNRVIDSGLSAAHNLLLHVTTMSRVGGITDFCNMFNSLLADCNASIIGDQKTVHSFVGAGGDKTKLRQRTFLLGLISQNLNSQYVATGLADPTVPVHCQLASDMWSHTADIVAASGQGERDRYLSLIHKSMSQKAFTEELMRLRVSSSSLFFDDNHSTSKQDDAAHLCSCTLHLLPGSMTVGKDISSLSLLTRMLGLPVTSTVVLCRRILDLIGVQRCSDIANTLDKAEQMSLVKSLLSDLSCRQGNFKSSTDCDGDMEVGLLNHFLTTLDKKSIGEIGKEYKEELESVCMMEVDGGNPLVGFAVSSGIVSIEPIFEELLSLIFGGTSDKVYQKLKECVLSVNVDDTDLLYSGSGECTYRGRLMFLTRQSARLVDSFKTFESVDDATLHALTALVAAYIKVMPLFVDDKNLLAVGGRFMANYLSLHPNWHLQLSMLGQTDKSSVAIDGVVGANDAPKVSITALNFSTVADVGIETMRIINDALPSSVVHSTAEYIDPGYSTLSSGLDVETDEPIWDPTAKPGPLRSHITKKFLVQTWELLFRYKDDPNASASIMDFLSKFTDYNGMLTDSYRESRFTSEKPKDHHQFLLDVMEHSVSVRQAESAAAAFTMSKISHTRQVKRGENVFTADETDRLRKMIDSGRPEALGGIVQMSKLMCKRTDPGFLESAGFYMDIAAKQAGEMSADQSSSDSHDWPYILRSLAEAADAYSQHGRFVRKNVTDAMVDHTKAYLKVSTKNYRLSMDEDDSLSAQCGVATTINDLVYIIHNDSESILADGENAKNFVDLVNLCLDVDESLSGEAACAAQLKGLLAEIAQGDIEGEAKEVAEIQNQARQALERLADPDTEVKTLEGLYSKWVLRGDLAAKDAVTLVFERSELEFLESEIVEVHRALGPTTNIETPMGREFHFGLLCYSYMFTMIQNLLTPISLIPSGYKVKAPTFVRWLSNCGAESGPIAEDLVQSTVRCLAVAIEYGAFSIPGFMVCEFGGDASGVSPATKNVFATAASLLDSSPEVDDCTSPASETLHGPKEHLQPITSSNTDHNNANTPTEAEVDGSKCGPVLYNHLPSIISGLLNAHRSDSSKLTKAAKCIKGKVPQIRPEQWDADNILIASDLGMFVEDVNAPRLLSRLKSSLKGMPTYNKGQYHKMVDVLPPTERSTNGSSGDADSDDLNSLSQPSVGSVRTPESANLWIIERLRLARLFAMLDRHCFDDHRFTETIDDIWQAVYKGQYSLSVMRELMKVFRYSTNDTMADEFVSHQMAEKFKSLVSHWDKASDDDLLSDSLAIVGYMSMCPSVKKEFSSINFVAPCVQVVMKNSSRYNKILNDSSITTSLMKSYYRGYVNHSDLSLSRLQQNACLAVGELVRGSLSNSADFGNAAGIKYLLRILDSSLVGSTDFALANAATLCICNVCHRRDDFKRAFGAAGAPQSIVDVLSAFNSSPCKPNPLTTPPSDIVYIALDSSFKAIGNLSLEAENIERFIDADVVGVLESFYSNDLPDSLVASSLLTVVNLTLENEDAFVNYFRRVMRILIDILNDPRKADPTVQCAVLESLASLCSDGEGVATLLKYNGIKSTIVVLNDALMQLVATGIVDSFSDLTNPQLEKLNKLTPVLTNVMLLVQKVSRSAEARLALYRDDVVSQMCQVVKLCHSWDLCRTTLKTLSRLLRYDTITQPMLCLNPESLGKTIIGRTKSATATKHSQHSATPTTTAQELISSTLNWSIVSYMAMQAAYSPDINATLAVGEIFSLLNGLLSLNPIEPIITSPSGDVMWNEVMTAINQTHLQSTRSIEETIISSNVGTFGEPEDSPPPINGANSANYLSDLINDTDEVTSSPVRHNYAAHTNTNSSLADIPITPAETSSLDLLKKLEISNRDALLLADAAWQFLGHQGIRSDAVTAHCLSYLSYACAHKVPQIGDVFSSHNSFVKLAFYPLVRKVHKSKSSGLSANISRMTSLVNNGFSFLGADGKPVASRLNSQTTFGVTPAGWEGMDSAEPTPALSSMNTPLDGELVDDNVYSGSMGGLSRSVSGSSIASETPNMSSSLDTFTTPGSTVEHIDNSISIRRSSSQLSSKGTSLIGKKSKNALTVTPEDNMSGVVMGLAADFLMSACTVAPQATIVRWAKDLKWMKPLIAGLSHKSFRQAYPSEKLLNESVLANLAEKPGAAAVMGDNSTRHSTPSVEGLVNSDIYVPRLTLGDVVNKSCIYELFALLKRVSINEEENHIHVPSIGQLTSAPASPIFGDLLADSEPKDTTLSSMSGDMSDLTSNDSFLARERNEKHAKQTMDNQNHILQSVSEEWETAYIADYHTIFSPSGGPVKHRFIGSRYNDKLIQSEFPNHGSSVTLTPLDRWVVISLQQPSLLHNGAQDLPRAIKAKLRSPRKAREIYLDRADGIWKGRDVYYRADGELKSLTWCETANGLFENRLTIGNCREILIGTNGMSRALLKELPVLEANPKHMLTFNTTTGRTVYLCMEGVNRTNQQNRILMWHRAAVQ